MFDSVLLPEERGESGDLSTEGGSYVLGAVGRKISNARHQSCENDVLLDQFSESCSVRCDESQLEGTKREEADLEFDRRRQF